MAFHMDEFGVPKFRQLGASVLIVDVSGGDRLKNQERIWRLHAESRAWNGVRESVPGMNNLTLFYDEARASSPELERRLRESWNSNDDIGRLRQSMHVVDVRYGGEYGPDLSAVAEAVGLTECEVVALHAERVYVVYFVGFQPGFAYLGDVNERLHLPRRNTPRAAVPAGSVAIALHHTAVYPFASPGGWHIIGRTSERVFDPASGKAQFAPGDRVRFAQTG